MKDGSLRREGALSPHGGITDALFIIITDDTTLAGKRNRKGALFGLHFSLLIRARVIYIVAAHRQAVAAMCAFILERRAVVGVDASPSPGSPVSLMRVRFPTSATLFYGD